MHRAESIMQAIAINITGLATTGANVYRGRAYAVPALPALSLYQGGDESAAEQSFKRVTREMDVHIEIHAQSTAQIETELNAIRAEVYAALMADITQGLGYVIDTQWRADSAPEIEAEIEQPTARVVMTWVVIYQHSLTSAEA